MLKSVIKKGAVLLTGVGMMFSSSLSAGEVEVLHWWTSGGEAKSVGVLKDLLKKEGHDWKDMAVAGGGGGNALTVLRTRVVSGNPPSSAQIKGPEIQNWGEEGVLADLSEVAKAGKWDEIMPPMIANIHKYEGKYVAVPANVHRLNWMYINPEVFKKANAPIPKTWDEFFASMEKIKEAGLIPIAFGGQAWQELAVFDSVALSVGGPEFYKRAFVDKDMNALGSATMKEIFTTFGKLRSYVDRNHPGRDWNLATAMVINGQAGVQFMGDWAKGEFSAAGKMPGKDYLCLHVPNTENTFSFILDTFLMFEQEEAGKIAAQKALARIVLEPEFQTVFNINKGSIPILQDLDRSKFDSCANLSMDDYNTSTKKGTLVPSMAFDMASYPVVTGAIRDVVSNFWNTEVSEADAVQQLVKAIKSAQIYSLYRIAYLNSIASQ